MPHNLGIQGICALHRFCHSLEGNRRFLVDRLDFAEVAVSSPELERRTRQRSAIFQAGDCVVVCSEPLGEGPAERYLRRHPEGIGGIALEVSDVEKALGILDRRGGTPTSDVQRFSSDEGLGIFSITTPLDDVLFYFVQRRPGGAPLPGFIPHDKPKGGQNRFGFTKYDHITSNFQTMSPALLWFEHVLGFSRYWDVEFHTNDIEPEDDGGTGLRSVVMYDEGSQLKFANNEPVRPNFDKSQIALFCADQRGNGVQHAAIELTDIMSSVPELRERGVRFVNTPGGYYDKLPARLERLGIGPLEESIDELRHHEILVDGDKDEGYLLQLFMEDAARFEGDPKKSPFFFELIQRKGDRGFGAGNFRALFEGVEKAQTVRVRP